MTCIRWGLYINMVRLKQNYLFTYYNGLAAASERGSDRGCTCILQITLLELYSLHTGGTEGGGLNQENTSASMEYIF